MGEHTSLRLSWRLGVLIAALALTACLPPKATPPPSTLPPLATDAPTSPPTSLPTLTSSPSVAAGIPSLPPSSTPPPTPTAAPPARTTYTTTSQETRGAVTLITIVHTTRYEIGGATATDIDTAMRTWGPVDPLGGYHWFALTEPLFDWRYSCPCGEGGCVSGPVTAYLTISYTFPRWTASAGAEPALAAQWTTFEAALIEHEHGHGALAAECAWALGEALAALPPAASCAALDAAAASASQAVFADCREAQRRYEDETDHGRTQGVIWPPG